MAEADIDLDSVIDRLLEGKPFPPYVVQLKRGENLRISAWLVAVGVWQQRCVCGTILRDSLARAGRRCGWSEGWNGGDCSVPRTPFVYSLRGFEMHFGDERLSTVQDGTAVSSSPESRHPTPSYAGRCPAVDLSTISAKPLLGTAMT